MSYEITKGFVPAMAALLIFCVSACKKETVAEEAKIKPPVRTYDVTARIDKKGTNSNSEGTAILKGSYNEETKQLGYSLEYKDLMPRQITLRSGAKGSVGSFIKELYNIDKELPGRPVTGSLTLTPLYERNLLKGQWFVAITTAAMSPEISGVLTLKQK